MSKPAKLHYTGVQSLVCIHALSDQSCWLAEACKILLLLLHTFSPNIADLTTVLDSLYTLQLHTPV